jgi:hypothetical protein
VAEQLVKQGEQLIQAGNIPEAQASVDEALAVLGSWPGRFRATRASALSLSADILLELGEQDQVGCWMTVSAVLDALNGKVLTRWLVYGLQSRLHLSRLFSVFKLCCRTTTGFASALPQHCLRG